MNWSMIGHEWAVQLLQEHLTQKRLRHAYLFTGPEGVGRRTLALRLAQALNCTAPPAPGEACLACRTCQQIERMQHPDLAVLQAEQRGGILKVDQVRELQRNLSLAPYVARYRVAVLLRFEEANASAQNALLKTLEEPPDRVVLILTADSSEILLPTIVSRCEVLRLRPAPLEQVSLALAETRQLPPEQARLLAHIAGGRPGFALRLYQDEAGLEGRLTWMDDLRHLLTANRVERFAYADNLSRDKDVLRQVIQVWISYFRDVLLTASRASVPLANLDRSEEIRQLADQVGLEQSQHTIKVLERTLELIGRNVNPRLASEVMMIDLPRLQWGKDGV